MASQASWRSARRRREPDGVPKRPDVESRDPAMSDPSPDVLDRRRLEADTALHEATPRLLAGFSSDPIETPRLTAALRHFCDAALDLLPADGVSVWLHQREDNEIELVNAAGRTTRMGGRIRTDDAASPLVRAFRGLDAVWIPGRPEGSAGAIAVPLRGRRRALGLLAADGVRVAPSDLPALLDRITRLAAPLAASIEQVQLLDEVIRSRRELENTFDALTDLVAVCDRRLAIVHVNDEFSLRVGKSREAVIGRPIADYINRDTAAWIATASAEAMQHGTVLHHEDMDATLKGTFAFTLSRRVGVDGQPVGTVVLARDISEHRRLELERAQLNERLAHTEKLAALGQFVAGVAHELNNPLQGVLGHIDLIRAGGELPKQIARDLRLIEREAERAARIIRDLLVFARARTPRARRPIRVTTVLAKVLALRANALKAGRIELVRALPADLPKVSAEALLLQQAFLNIVLNAEQALRGVGGGQLFVSASLPPDANRVIVTVRDTGPGIPAETLPRVFEPFFTTKSVGEGTGLGLALTYGIIHDHGGDIVVTNHPLGGAQFTVYLPVLPNR